MRTTEGEIVSVRRVPGGAALVAPVTPGDLVLELDWAIDFTPDRRRLLRIGGEDDNETLAYTAIDDETEILTLEPPGAVLAWDIDDPVVPLDATGENPTEAWEIDVDMGDGGTRLCKPSHALQDKLREDRDYEGIRCDVQGNEVVTLHDKAASSDPGSTVFPLVVAHLPSNVTIPDGTGFTDVTGWLIDDLRAGMVYDGIASWQVPLNGYYSLADSAMLWQANGTGRRFVQPRFATGFGDIPGGISKLPGDASVQVTTPVFTKKQKLSAGEWIKLTVSQTSGGNLDLIGDAFGISSFVCIKYEGPW